MAAFSLPLLAVGALALAALLLAMRQLWVVRRLRLEVRRLSRELAEKNEPEPATDAPARFSESLSRVERKQLDVPAAARSGQEKYRYIAALAEQGLDAGGIAAALQMSVAEVEQLLQLTRLKERSMAGGR